MTDTRGNVRIEGRVLYLTEDEAQLRAQLYEGADLDPDPERSLVNNISTDEITPGWVCYYYDETLARYCLVGLRGGAVEKDAIKTVRVQLSSRSNDFTSRKEINKFPLTLKISR